MDDGVRQLKNMCGTGPLRIDGNTLATNEQVAIYLNTDFWSALMRLDQKLCGKVLHTCWQGKKNTIVGRVLSGIGHCG